jgi:Ca2+-binding RTX toxin-like protein
MNEMHSPSHQAQNLFVWGLGLLAIVAVALMVPSSSGAGQSGQRCFGKNPTIVGNNGNNQIVGTQGRDVIIALGGKDSIRSRRGKDFVCAGAGNDTIHAAEGIGYMDGGPGDDWLDGRRGRGNVSIGDRGDDLIQAEGKIDGGPGNDEIESYGYLRASASPFADVTKAGGGRDQISGCNSGRVCIPPGNGELLKGGPKNDRIFAGDGPDRVRGNGGNDTLNGEAGNDSINGGSGSDVCNQGPGTGTLSNCP